MTRKIEHVWLEKSRNGKYWVRNSVERITSKTLPKEQAEAVVAYINGTAK